MNKNIIISAAVALVVGAIVGLVLVGQSSQSTLVGGLSERDVKAVTLSVGNTGQFSVTSAGVVTSGAITSGAITSSGDITASGTGTSTLKLTSSTSGRGGCIELKTTNGSSTRMYLAGTTTVLTIEEGTCE